ncbi:bifunctional 4-hydroxy-2-oxoglutarate aldolase/2-dehydro-3-deoxy-phosphogluconate aldolase [Sedimentisphaera salicampi]|uniref:2-dehydro-3-deoxy-phosphogluconate aldolase n=1 Tax=Sedimentisphaera salicampi TaxID=1941349 RepID=A0A1W6LMF2_9BACT|nr:bifunctional 4-hydroxy-2-oxoglutarate aldolase/2-dehydro-3-deoxy-phosphogluconate aldolase [Sedimentisphaera salicampi]ARN56955.1 Putative KHG/KDPG aldolase [Sedimentisphaera salicampi]
MHSYEDIFQRIKQERIVATVVIDDLDKVPALAETLLEAGMSSIELTLRTDCGVDAISVISREYPEMLVGAGTVLSCGQVRQVAEAGAEFAVAPGFNPAVAEEAVKAGLPFAPGVCTPSDVEQALSCNCKYLKFFPAEPLGGIKYLKSMAAPYLHLGIGFIPLGGINAENFTHYLSQPYITAVGGSWLAPRQAISKGDWKLISNLCKEAKNRLEN